MRKVKNQKRVRVDVLARLYLHYQVWGKLQNERKT
jgi:hypothetical protein